MTDREILENLRAGSDSALVILSNCYGAYCRTIAFRILQNEEDVEECLNDVYLKIWRIAQSEDIANLKHYIASTTRNVAVDIYNKCKSQQATTQELYQELEECGWVQDSTSEATDAIVIKDTLNAFLLSLDKTERWIFMRRYWNMDDIKAIAAACGKREATVRMILSRTRKKLKDRLEKEGIIL